MTDIARPAADTEMIVSQKQFGQSPFEFFSYGMVN